MTGILGNESVLPAPVIDRLLADIFYAKKSYLL